MSIAPIWKWFKCVSTRLQKPNHTLVIAAAGWEPRDWVECNGEKHQRGTWLACNARGGDEVLLCLFLYCFNWWKKLLKPYEIPALLWMMQNIIASNKIDYFYILNVLWSCTLATYLLKSCYEYCVVQAWWVSTTTANNWYHLISASFHNHSWISASCPPFILWCGLPATQIILDEFQAYLLEKSHNRQRSLTPRAATAWRISTGLSGAMSRSALTIL